MGAPDPPQRSTGEEHRCHSCGYDMRGTNSTRCAECGAEHVLPLEFGTPVQFHQAKSILTGLGIPFQAIEPGGALGSIGVLYTLGPANGRVFVPHSAVDRARDALEAAGIPASVGLTPIVDRAEPECFQCRCELDPNSDPTCPKCGLKFLWVSIEPDDETAPEARDVQADSAAQRQSMQIIVVAVLVAGLVLVGFAARSVLEQPSTAGYVVLSVLIAIFALVVICLAWRGMRSH